MEEETQRQGGVDREVRVLRWRAPRARSLRCPGCDGRPGQPDCDVAPTDQGSLVGRPVSDAVFRLVFRMDSRLHPSSLVWVPLNLTLDLCNNAAVSSRSVHERIAAEVKRVLVSACAAQNVPASLQVSLEAPDGGSQRIATSKRRILEILGESKSLAKEYRRLSGKPLGITGEVAEYEAARILGIDLTPVRQAGYDAVETKGDVRRKLQIKGRCLLENAKPGQRLGSIHSEKEWDAVLMVLLDENFDATHIYEADRPSIIAALTAPGSKARTERGALSVSKFKSIGKLRWSRPAVY